MSRQEEGRPPRASSAGPAECRYVAALREDDRDPTGHRIAVLRAVMLVYSGPRLVGDVHGDHRVFHRAVVAEAAKANGRWSIGHGCRVPGPNGQTRWSDRADAGGTYVPRFARALLLAMMPPSTSTSRCGTCEVAIAGASPWHKRVRTCGTGCPRAGLGHPAGRADCTSC